MIKKSVRFKVLYVLGGAFILFFSIAPVYSAIVVSLTPASHSLDPISIPRFFETANFVNVMQYILRPMLNSFFYAIVTTVIVLVISIPSAYVLSRFRFKGRQAFRFVLLFTQMLAGVVLMPAVYSIFVRLGLVNSVPALIFIFVGVSLSLSVWLLFGFLASVPVEIEEAAIIDGAGRFRLLYGIVVPIIKPGIAVSAIFTFVGTYNEFVIPLFLMNDASHGTVTMTLNSFMTAITIDWNLLAAGSIIGMLPPLLIFLIFQKYIIGGAAAGAIKG
ncbi:MAG: carbohydrate ABC transporter permease [Clostridia bacterium]